MILDLDSLSHTEGAQDRRFPDNEYFVLDPVAIMVRPVLVPLMRNQKNQRNQIAPNQ
jgi:hypothetical protein